MNTTEELKFVKDIATATGIVLDPVYRCNIFLLYLMLKSGTLGLHCFSMHKKNRATVQNRTGISFQNNS
jgi:1-aminocyclopropane-1-carboxylate deaminase/D-cysteine desulfhydrase-like pyridoxal-dependent ACC family enzyme